MQVTYTEQGRTYPRVVWFASSSAIRKGMGVCYVPDWYNANTGYAKTDALGKRANIVSEPKRAAWYDPNDTSSSYALAANNFFFAGVAAQNYPAKTGGQFIQIYEPGSICEVEIGIATTAATSILECSAMTSLDGGRFTRTGKAGTGSVQALQTVANLTSTSTSLVGPVYSCLDNSGTIGAGDSTVTKTDAFLYAAAGDTVVILAGETSATSAAAVTAGSYTIVTRLSKDAAVLSSSPCAAASNCSFYVIRGKPTCLAKILDGPQTGLQETVTTIANTEVSPTNMVGGTTHVVSAAIGTGDSTITIANGSTIAWRKAVTFQAGATTPGNDLMVTPNSSNILTAAAAAVTAVELDANSESCEMEWSTPLGKWILLSAVGTVS